MKFAPTRARFVATVAKFIPTGANDGRTCASIVAIGAKAHHRRNCALIGRRFGVILTNFAAIAESFVVMLEIDAATFVTIGVIGGMRAEIRQAAVG
jgi:hypothetical protein